ncbi:MAG: DUF4293 domain-containing protein [Lentimicrobiaceae bacterium]|jgi:hypothetical protein|nr:DUF4293 domain-containing protein [Lentimicrobiaceae bacterium]
MIQRIQTVYLALASIALIILFFVPIAFFGGTLQSIVNLEFYIYQLKDLVPGATPLFPSWFAQPLALLVGIIILVNLKSIFLYKNRTKQISHVKVNIFLTMLLIVAILFVYINLIERKAGVKPDYHGALGIYLPISALILIVLAYRSIMRDEKLVRSADRLR